MMTFFLNLLLRLQSAIHLMKIESTAVEMFLKMKTAIFEAVFNRIMPIEEKIRPRYENTTEFVFFLYSFRHFHVRNRRFYARNP